MYVLPDINRRILKIDLYLLSKESRTRIDNEPTRAQDKYTDIVDGTLDEG